MKNRITLLFFLTSVFLLQAQTKTTVAFLTMSYDEETIGKTEARMVQETVTNAFVSSKKFTVVDRQKLEELEKEKNLQRSESFMDSQNSFTDGLSKGANYLVDGSIMDINYSEGKGGWTANVTIQLRMLDVSTGEIMATGIVNSQFEEDSPVIKKAMKSLYSKDELKAIEAKNALLQASKEHKKDAFSTALMRLAENTKRFTGTILPIQVEVVSWDNKKNEIVLAAGSHAGVQVGQLVDVVKISEVSIGDDTVVRNEVVGTAWIVRVDDQNFSVASIIDNQKEINKASKANERIGMIIR